MDTLSFRIPNPTRMHDDRVNEHRQSIGRNTSDHAWSEHLMLVALIRQPLSIIDWLPVNGFVYEHEKKSL